MGLSDTRTNRAASRLAGAAASTPRPWQVFTTRDGLKVIGIGSLDGGGICDAGFGVWRWQDAEGLANAELIVRAVNAHDDLLAACKEFVRKVESGEARSTRSYNQMKAAIAKAEAVGDRTAPAKTETEA